MRDVRLGAAQRRALVDMAADPMGAIEVPAASAAGLIAKGLATRVARPHRSFYAPFTCRITDQGREYVAQEVRALLSAAVSV